MARQTWWLELDCPEIAGAACPGQFVMIGFGLKDPAGFMLPRPFSIGWRSTDGRLGLLVRVFGRGTRRLADLRVGDSTLLLGPLGRGFIVDAGRDLTCVAGGVGLAPFIFLAAELTGGSRAAPSPASIANGTFRLLYGERTGDAVFDPGLIHALTGVDPEVFTEDGELGREGRVTAGLDPDSDALLAACGPTPMLVAVAEWAFEHQKQLQVSVEEHMGCGIGTCQGCVVRGADGRWIKACLEGPVFDARRLAWP